MKNILLTLVFLLSLPSGAFGEKLLSYEVVKESAHNSAAFTQGLTLNGDWLIESSGLYGKSFITIYHQKSGAPKAKWIVPSKEFAEGLTLFDNKLYLLTWTAGVLHILDGTTLKPLGTKTFQGEGWGLTHDGKQFIMSDGSDQLFFRDNNSFAVTGKVHVRDGHRPYGYLNELEFARGAVWANVWQSNIILRIDPTSGEVTGILDLEALARDNDKIPGHTVLNGIAYDKTNDAFWITGKLWPTRYLIKVADH